ncbi:hypothetical protein CSPAE12_04356 [Colletotrichum incanum]|nr:hypothetical protein CSPAE12_04356 [Colletotrichum incanum]
MAGTLSDRKGIDWQKRLEGELLHTAQPLANIADPVFQLISERRGRRTAWSSRVIVDGRTFQAQFWYDGKNEKNMRDNAAEIAVTYLANWHDDPVTRRLMGKFLNTT